MLTLNDNGALAYLSGILARMADMQPVMHHIGDHMVNRIQTRLIEDKTDPDGHAWSVWRPFTREQREKKGNTGQGLLWDTGTLLHSIHARTGVNSVTISTDVPYAHELQYGRTDMAARPFIGWGGEDGEVAEHQVVRYLEGINA